MGIGDWGLGIGDWGLGVGRNPQSPIPHPQSPIPKILCLFHIINYIYIYNTKLINKLDIIIIFNN